MTPPLFLLDELPPTRRSATLQLGDAIHLGGEEGRHAARVKRIGPGEPVLVSDGRGALAACTVEAVLSDGLRLRVDGCRVVPRPDPVVVVVQALPKGERAELAVEVLTELGVDAIVPWAASRSIAQWHGARGEKALEKWRRTAREAAKQSRRPWLPRVEPLATTAAVAALIAAAAVSVVLHEDAAVSLAAVTAPGAGDIVVVVGPEGGITPDELTDFVEAGATPVRLGDGILRTSTAGAAALSALSLRLGRWS